MRGKPIVSVKHDGFRRCAPQPILRWRLLTPPSARSRRWSFLIAWQEVARFGRQRFERDLVERRP